MGIPNSQAQRITPLIVDSDVWGLAAEEQNLTFLFCLEMHLYVDQVICLSWTTLHTMFW